MPASSLPPELVQAYVQTEFRVQADPEFSLSIGQISEQIKALHALHGVSASTFITAFNPLGVALSTLENEVLQNQLVQSLERERWLWICGEGRDRSGQWPAEQSVLVLGMGREQAGLWGHQYKQNAVVLIEASGVPELVLLQ